MSDDHTRNGAPVYIGVVELARRLDGVYSRRRLSTLAATGAIPGAEPKPPTGKQWRFKDTPELARWIAEAKESRPGPVGYTRAPAKDPRHPNFVTYARKIEQHFEIYPPDVHTPDQCITVANMLQGVAAIYNSFRKRAMGEVGS
jgi:hypothetical protein